MEKVKNFNSFLSDLILEQIGQGELPIKLSKRLSNLLGELNHTIADRLLEDDEDGMPSKFTLIDLDDKEIDMFTYATSPKITEYIVKNTNTEDLEKNLKYYDSHAEVRSEMWTVNRSPIKIGKLINKIYPNMFVNAGKSGQDIESFVNAVKSERSKHEGKFKIVKGEDIVKYYNQDKYESGSYSALHNSCMAYSHCAPYIGFYANNDVELVVLMSDKGDIIRGRAILWNLTHIDGRKVERKFMDRIYTIQQHDVEKFINLAEKNGWLYKKDQDMYDSTPIIDTVDDTEEQRILKIKGIKKHKAYPYMDTMKYFNIRGGFLTNDENSAGSSFITLESADGGYINSNGYELSYDEYSDSIVNEDDMVWLDNEDRNMHRDHAVYSEYEGEWASPEYAEEHWKYSKLEEDWIPEDYMVYVSSIKQWVSDNYADDHFNKCDFDDEYYKENEILESDVHGCVPKKKAVFVITEEDMDLDDYVKLNFNNYNEYFGGQIDVRYKGDKSYFTVTDVKTGKEYHIDNYLKGTAFVKNIKKGVI